MQLFLLYFIFTMTEAVYLSPGLRAKYGRSGKFGEDIFLNLPREADDAIRIGWKQYKPPPSPYPEDMIDLFCPPELAICILYDDTAYLAGIQLAIPVEYMKEENPGLQYVKWKPSENVDQEYWTSTLYTIQPNFLNKNPNKRMEIRYKHNDTLQEHGLWVRGMDGKLLRIPDKQEEMDCCSEFTRQSCVPHVGRHYFYKMTIEKPCDKMLAWYALFNKNNLIGCGYVMFGADVAVSATPGSTDWFEHRSPAEIKTMFIDTPACLANTEDPEETELQIASLHFYFIDDPRQITCVSN